jgi:peptide/nickel transport system ATP-binding protein
MAGPVLEIANLSVAIRGSGDRPHAVRGINITVGANEIVCVVGESSSGKSVTAQAMMGLLPKNAMQVETGSIRMPFRRRRAPGVRLAARWRRLPRSVP